MALNIGFDGHVLTGRFQGTRTTLSSLLRAMGPKIAGRRVVIYSDDSGAARAMIGSDNFEYKHLENVGSIKRLLVTLPRLLRRDRIDVGVFQYMAPMVGDHIVFIHDILPITHPHLFPVAVRIRSAIFFRVAILRAKLVITVSDFTRAEVKKAFRVSDSRLKTVLNGPSFAKEVYATGCSSVKTKYILAVGRIEPRKNIPMLVDSFLRANVPGLRLIIVGALDLGFKYEMPNSAEIELKSDVSEEGLIDLYKGASLFVYPSQAEGFGVPLLDAILFGIPTISSNQTSLKEVGGELVKYFDPTEGNAVDVLAGLLEGHFGCSPISGPSDDERRKHADHFSWDRAADEFLKAVDDIA